MLTFIGELKVKGQTEQVTEKFTKRTFVLSDNHDKYPQTVEFQLTQDRCMLLDSVNIGTEIEVTFVLKGREWRNPAGQTKYFNSLEVLKVKDVYGRNQITNELNGEGDDLPF